MQAVPQEKGGISFMFYHLKFVASLCRSFTGVIKMALGNLRDGALSNEHARLIAQS
jgi:hypothetical protein